MPKFSRRSTVPASDIETRKPRRDKIIERRDATLRIWFPVELPFHEESDGSVVFTDSSRQVVRTLQAAAIIVSAIVLVPTLQLIGTLIAVGGNTWLLTLIGSAIVACFAYLLIFISRRFSTSRCFQLRRDGCTGVRESTRNAEHTQTYSHTRLVVHRVQFLGRNWDGWALFLHADRKSYILAMHRKRARIEQYVGGLPPLARQQFRGEGDIRILGGISAK
jgi:hypothetical protein